MSSTSRAWIAAASVGAVEALKDQGFCRWNYSMRSVHHHAKARLRSFSQAKNLSSPSPAAAASASRVRGGEEAKQSEESLRKVMSGCRKTDARSDPITQNQEDEFGEQSLDCGNQRWNSGGLEGPGVLQVELHHKIDTPPRQGQPQVPSSGKQQAFFSVVCGGLQQVEGTEGQAIRGVAEESHVLELLGSQLIQIWLLEA
ncbi:hypothetical protein RHSIM_Rhsim06G0152600 [Rhododendron simsii]|uniref:Wound-responsive family protein n=1 Tax=Rhododendron simsii TaxID=118357 RepID=A0A834GRE9_RHOSS|nr:hypothetical protein RHSIM_Rhsim06G0152600 [Rhododendron simsii]